MDGIADTIRVLRRFNLFWAVFTSVTLAFCTVVAVNNHPNLFHEGRGVWCALLIVLYAVWYWGFILYLPRFSWFSDYQSRTSLLLRLGYWSILFAIPILLATFDMNYGYLVWSVFGVGFGLVRMPWSMLLATGPMLYIFHMWGVFPPNNTTTDWLSFVGSLFSILAFCGIMVMLSSMIHGRFERERLFQSLQKAHADLSIAHAQLAVSAAHERELAVYRERGRLAREMHDTLGHALVLTTMKLEAVKRLMSVQPERAAHEIVVTQNVVREAMAELRATLVTLREPETVIEPFTIALERHAHALAERTGMHVECALWPTAATWPETIQSALLRIGSEAMHNVEQHAKAQHMTLVVADESDHALLRVSDDGVGLPSLPLAVDGCVTSPDGHFGLAGMRERVASLGGTMVLTSSPQSGTRLDVRLPITTAQAATDSQFTATTSAA